MKFEIIKKSKKSKARAGILHTNHGPIETPVFMPVGTQGTVKALTPEMLAEIGVEIILGNTYHLSLRPGADLIEKFGGLHKLINWNKPILTDSGGYQVFSLSKMRKITKDGVSFRSHIDGSKKMFTPESVVDLQRKFNSDIMMPLDICSAYPSDKSDILREMKITHKWEQAAKDYWEKKTNGQLLFGIIQGGMHKDLREQSAKAISKIDFPGYAIGGLSVGEPIELMEEYIEFTVDFMPEKKPRYLMGVGLPENLDFAIHKGIDMFDCVMPTRLARHGHFFTSAGRKNIRNSQFINDEKPLADGCTCYTCKHYSRAYLRHLFVAKEILSMILMTYHNVFYLVNFVKKIRKEILLEQ
jgi:queuine tRNA-ribosyltransferase